MGIRVHKTVGYGITNLKIDSPDTLNPTMLDPRLDWEKLAATAEERCATSLQDFMSWMQRNKADIIELHRREDPRAISGHSFQWDIQMIEQMLERDPQRMFGVAPEQCFIHETEGGDPQVLMFVPPECSTQWHRRDNTLDWVEESQWHGQQTRVRRLRQSGIYPYNGFRIRFRKPARSFRLDPTAPVPSPDELGNIVDELGPVKLCDSTYSYLTGVRRGPRVRGDDLYGPMATGALLRHLKRDFRPPLPMTVVALVLWLDCVIDPAAFLDQLRPLLYAYWC